MYSKLLRVYKEPRNPTGLQTRITCLDWLLAGEVVATRNADRRTTWGVRLGVRPLLPRPLQSQLDIKLLFAASWGRRRVLVPDVSDATVVGAGV